MGQDLNLSLDRVLANRNFTNKLWNAGKFIAFNLEQVVCPTQPCLCRASLKDIVVHLCICRALPPNSLQPQSVVFTYAVHMKLLIMDTMCVLICFGGEVAV